MAEKERYIPEPKDELWGPTWEDLTDQALELRQRVSDESLLPWMVLAMLGHLAQLLTDIVTEIDPEDFKDLEDLDK